MRSIRGHHAFNHAAVLGAVKAASLRSAAAFRGASGLDRACAQRAFGNCVMAAEAKSGTRANSFERARCVSDNSNVRKDFNVDAYIVDCTLPVCTVKRRGEPVFPTSQPDGR